jgi:uncharacterized phiE125 gp8 family phage protein
MSLSIQTPPYGEVLTVEEAKGHLKAAIDVTEDDSLIAVQIAAARELIETGTGANRDRCKTMLATTFVLVMDCFPGHCIEIPRVPLISVVSITYVDLAGTTQTLATSVYTVDTASGKIDLGYLQFWPSTRTIPNAVTVRFIAGLAAKVTAVAGTDLLTVYGRTFANNDVLQLINSGGTLPGGLSSGTPYYVVNASGSTFKLSLTSGGSAIDVTQAGTGIHYAGMDASGFTALRQAVLLQVAKYYRNRGDAGWEIGSTIDRTQIAIDALIASQGA